MRKKRNIQLNDEEKTLVDKRPVQTNDVSI